MAAIEKAGHPVVRITMPGIYELGAEFFRWEIATAAAGAIIGINPFNQPDVEASKIATRSLTTEYEKTGSLPSEQPVLEDQGIKLFTDEKNAAELAKACRQLVAGGIPQSPFVAHSRRRLFRHSGIHTDESRARGRAAGYAPCGAR